MAARAMLSGFSSTASRPSIPRQGINVIPGRSSSMRIDEPSSARAPEERSWPRRAPRWDFLPAQEGSQGRCPSGADALAARRKAAAVRMWALGFVFEQHDPAER